MYDDLGCEEGDHCFFPCDCPECDEWSEPEDKVQVCSDCGLEC